MYDVVVIGGGPSGVMASIVCSERGLKTLLIEKNNDILNKFKLTGGGRCNLTNNLKKQDFLREINNSLFFKDSFNSFSNFDLKKYFEKNKIIFNLEGHKVFPKSGKSVELINVLKEKLNNVKIINEEVINISKEDLFIIKTRSTILKSKNVIIATGGKSYPITGSTGFGYDIAKKFGHKVTDLYPSETFIYVENTDELSGISLEVTVKYLNYIEKGQILFTHFGMSGPSIMDLSEKIAKNIKKENRLIIDFLPNMSFEKIESEFIKAPGNIQLSTWLSNFFPKRLANYFFEKLQTKKMATISKKQRQEIINNLKNYIFIVKDVGSIEKAIVTSGGIDLTEIDSLTLESKKVKGLYFVGEVLDLHGPIGGFNLTIAFSTGYLAASSIQLTK